MNIIGIAIICTSFIYAPNGTDAVGGLRTALPPSLVDADKPTRMAAGWYDYVSTAPVCETNEGCVCTGFTRLGDDFTGIYKTYVIPTEAPMRYSVRSIIGELKSMGKFAAFRAFLEAANYDWDFVGSNYLASDDRDFQTMLSAIVAQGVLTQAELDAMLPKCIWEQTPMN